MMKRTHSQPTIEMVHEGKYAAEVDVTLIETEGHEWSPYFRLRMPMKLDAVRVALRRLAIFPLASKLARIYEIEAYRGGVDLQPHDFRGAT